MSGFRPWMIALLAAPVAAFAAGGGGGDSAPAPSDPVIAAVQAAVAEKDYRKAAELARQGLARLPDNADYHNLYAFALRKGPDPDMDLVFQHYRAALRLDPKHLGAHEYVGEAYLMVGNLAKAKEELAQLDRLCFFGCAEYTELKQAVAAYEAKTAR
jgi:tetratricopeptide (TPR) repeat protein